MLEKFHKFDNRIQAYLARLDAKRAEGQTPPVCDNTIICNNAEGCGRRNCPAFTVQPDTWHRKWRQLI